MSLGKTNFEDLSEADLQSLINAGVPESLIIEYKREVYGKSDKAKKEFLKDITSFANSSGGHLVLGLAAKKGIADEVPGIDQIINPDTEISRLQNLARDGIEPRILGVRMRAIPLGNSGFAVVIRIPKSWNPPHRVRAYNSNRFYIRNSNGVHEASVEELRDLFIMSATSLERARAFRNERLSKLRTSETPVKLARPACLMVHIVSMVSFNSTNQIDVKRAHEMQRSLRPIHSSGFSPRYNLDGFISWTGQEGMDGYVQVFRNGIIEAVLPNITREQNGLSFWFPNEIEKDIFSVLANYINSLASLGVPSPLVVMVSLTNIKGAFAYGIYPFPRGEHGPPIIAPDVVLPEVLIDDYGDDASYEKAMRSAFDALWNAGGLACSPNFADDGTWNISNRN